MAQDRLAKDQGRAGEWDVLEEGWERGEEIALGQVPAEIVFAPVVGQRFLTRQAFLAMIQVVPGVGQR